MGLASSVQTSSVGLVMTVIWQLLFSVSSIVEPGLVVAPLTFKWYVVVTGTKVGVNEHSAWPVEFMVLV